MGEIRNVTDFEKALAEFMKEKMRELSPSERKKISPTLLSMVLPEGEFKENVWFIEAFDVLNEGDKLNLEILLNNPKIEVSGNKWEWSPDGSKLLYILTLKGPRQAYRGYRYHQHETVIKPQLTWAQKFWKWCGFGQFGW